MKPTSTTRDPRDVARNLAGKWQFLQDLESAPVSELNDRRSTLLALQAASSGTRGKFPGTSYLESIQAELASRTRRRLAASTAEAQHRRRPAAGPYSAQVQAVAQDFNPKLHSIYA